MPRFDWYKDPPRWKLAALVVTLSPGILWGVSKIVEAWK